MLQSSVKFADDVYPLSFIDDSVLNRQLVSWIIHFNDVLDHQKVKDAFTRLLQIGDYRKFAGRLRTKSKGRLEIHVPQQFTSKRPPFLYLHDDQKTPLAAHPLSKYLGEVSSVPSIQPYSVELSAFIFGTGVSQDFKGRVDADVPLMSIQITSFTNATLLGLTFPHTLLDGTGYHAMWRGWSLVLAGRENEIPPILSANEALEKAVEEKPNQTKSVSSMDRWRLRGWKMIVWILRFIWSFIRSNGVTVRRMVIPHAAIERLRARATQDLANTAHKGAFVSENSVMTAWFARVLSMCQSNARPLTLISFFDGRARLRQLQQKGVVYVQNMILPLFIFVPRSLWGASVGEIALEIQSQAKERTTEAEALSWLKTIHNIYHTNSNPLFSLLAGESDAHLIGINNIEKYGFIQAIDFSPAVVSTTESKRVNPAGTPTHVTIHEKPERSGSFIYITGKDYGQNHWVIARMKPNEWAAMQNELDDLTLRMTSKI